MTDARICYVGTALAPCSSGTEIMGCLLRYVSTFRGMVSNEHGGLTNVLLPFGAISSGCGCEVREIWHED